MKIIDVEFITEYRDASRIKVQFEVDGKTYYVNILENDLAEFISNSPDLYIYEKGENRCMMN